jgi:hypothetical protein
MHRQTLVSLALGGLLIAGCGSTTPVNFKGKSRPAPAAGVSVYVSNQRVVVSPSQVAAGLVTFTVTNQASYREALWLAGTGGNCTLGTSGPVAPGQTAQFTVQMLVGVYTIGPCVLRGTPGATHVKLGALVVSAATKAGNDALLQP